MALGRKGTINSDSMVKRKNNGVVLLYDTMSGTEHQGTENNGQLSKG